MKVEHNTERRFANGDEIITIRAFLHEVTTCDNLKWGRWIIKLSIDDRSESFREVLLYTGDDFIWFRGVASGMRAQAMAFTQHGYRLKRKLVTLLGSNWENILIGMHWGYWYAANI